MSRRGGFPGGMGGFGGMNINQLMKEAKKMQADMFISFISFAPVTFTSIAPPPAVASNSFETNSS